MDNILFKRLVSAILIFFGLFTCFMVEKSGSGINPITIFVFVLGIYIFLEGMDGLIKKNNGKAS